MSPKIDIVTQEAASGSKIIIGIQVGLFGFVLRLGLYQQLA